MNQIASRETPRCAGSSRALERETVSAARAELLVRRAAYELILSPRHVDYRIWSRAYGTAG